MTRLLVGRVEELPPGRMVVVPYRRRGIAVINVHGELRALNNACPHQGGPLASGALTGTTTQSSPYEFGWEREGEILRCPWHRWEIDVLTGATLTEPVQRVPCYPVIVEAGEIFVEVAGA